MIDLVLLRSFVTVVDTGNFTRAAEHLHLTQSTVSQQILRLEQQLDCRLLDRSQRQVLPTEEGDRLLGYARRLLRLANEASEALSPEHTGGVLRLGVPEDLGSGALGPLQALTDPRAVDAVALSHLHADHCLDLCGLYVALRYHPGGPPPRRLPVHGPTGTAARLARAYDLDPDPGMTAELDVREWTPDAPLQVGPLTITPHPVEHPVEAYALRVEGPAEDDPTDDGSRRFADDGWLRTGDVGSVTRDGFLAIQDRARDLISSGGEWISSVQLENFILADERVAEVAVIGYPDDTWGERPLAITVLRGDNEPTAQTAEGLRDELRAHLPGWMIPEYWAFVERIDQTSVNKYDKKDLRARLARGEFEIIALGPAPRRALDEDDDEQQ